MDTVPELRDTIRGLVTTAQARRHDMHSADALGRKAFVALVQRIWKSIDRLATLSRSDAIEMASMAVTHNLFADNTTTVLYKLHPMVRESDVLRAMRKQEARERLGEQLARPRGELAEDLREHPHRLHRMLDDMLLVMGLDRRG